MPLRSASYFLVVLFSSSCGRAEDSAGPSPGSLADRLVDTTWACRWVALNGPLNSYPTVTSRVEVDHTLSFTETTLTDDLPDRLAEWAGASSDTYSRDVAYYSGFTDGASGVIATMDEVTWTAVAEDQILFSAHNAQGQFSGNVAMTVRWDSDGMWTESSFFGLISYSRCTRSSPAAGETGR